MMGCNPDIAKLPSARSMARYPATGAPKPPAVWQLVCEFANGACVCAHVGREAPCDAVDTIARRIRNTVLAEIAAEDRRRRKARPPVAGA